MSKTDISRPGAAAQFLSLVLALMVSSSAAVAQSVDDLTIITENYPPFNFQKEGVLQGIAVDTMVAMLQRVKSQQTRDDIRLLPWARGYELVLTQANTGLFSTTRTEEREKLFKWVGPIAPNRVGLIARKDKGITIEVPTDIASYKIGTIRDDVAEALLVEAGVPLAKLQRVGENIMNIKKLNHGRIDLWAYGEIVAMWDILANGFDPDGLRVGLRIWRAGSLLRLPPGDA